MAPILDFGYCERGNRDEWLQSWISGVERGTNGSYLGFRVLQERGQGRTAPILDFGYCERDNRDEWLKSWILGVERGTPWTNGSNFFSGVVRSG